MNAPNEIEARARDFYASFCAAGDGEWTLWESLPVSVQEQWRVVALRSMAHLFNALLLGNHGKEIGPYELGHFEDMDDRIKYWRHHMGK